MSQKKAKRGLFEADKESSELKKVAPKSAEGKAAMDRVKEL